MIPFKSKRSKKSETTVLPPYGSSSSLLIAAISHTHVKRQGTETSPHTNQNPLTSYSNPNTHYVPESKGYQYGGRHVHPHAQTYTHSHSTSQYHPTFHPTLHPTHHLASQSHQSHALAGLFS